jgi:hypothetical protein
VDTTAIQEAVAQHFNTLLSELIIAKEALVNSWLSTLMQVYATSKNACCCAIGNITSKQANRAFRLEIEKLRVKAAKSQMSLVLGNATDSALVYNLNTGTIKSPPDPVLVPNSPVQIGPTPLPVIVESGSSDPSDPRSFSREMVKPQEFSCEMSAQLVQWYEKSWHTGSCCGLWVTAGGSDWIVIHSGGASLNEPCVLAGISAGVQPAYAFPTLNGETFIGAPTSTQTMARNIDLESKIFMLLNNNSNQVHKVVGDPKTNLQAIVFPLST